MNCRIITMDMIY